MRIVTIYDRFTYRPSAEILLDPDFSMTISGQGYGGYRIREQLALTAKPVWLDPT